MKVIDRIKNTENRTLFSFEILPPLKGQNIKEIYDGIEPLMEFNPAFVDVTYHREEYFYKPLENGNLELKVIRKRPGTVGICAAIQHKYKVDAIPHVLCGGFSAEETENMLIELQFLGIDNLMALRGDAIKTETYFQAKPDGHRYATELVQQIKNLNKGIYIDETETAGANTDFCIGVAGYPEKHIEAPSLDFDIQNLKKKIENGADYIVTQMFFDNTKFFNFVDNCRSEGIHVPIIPGIKPLTSSSQLHLIPQRFHLDFPNELVEEVKKADSPQKVREIGVEWAIHQCKELIEYGVPVIHFYTMGKSANIKRIARSIF